MKTVSFAAFIAIALSTAASAGVLHQWQESVFVNGSNCVVNGRQVAGADGVESTEYTFANGTRLPAAFETAHQKRWQNVARPMAGRPAAITQQRTVPEPVSVRERIVQPSEAVVLAAPDLTAILREDALNSVAKQPRARRIGIVRDLPSPVVVNGSSLWMPTSDGGWVYTLRLSSSGAEAVRVAIENASVPAGAQFIVFQTGNPAQRRGPYSKAELAAAPRFWAESIWASDLTLECSLPPSVSPREVSFAVRQIGHTYVRASSSQAGAQFCENDVNCYPAWSNEAAAVALITLVDQGAQYLCTGCLLADSDPSDANTYFMTANHCVGDQTIASTVEFYWLDQTSACNGTPPSLSTVPTTTGGGTYLAGATYQQANDFSFMRLVQQPPAGTFLAGWSTATPANSDTLTVVHHPNGSWTRISFGNLSGAQDPNFWGVQWYSGVTEKGSSGSPLFNPAHQFLGQLYGGTSYCWNQSGLDDFGRFDKSWPIVKQWLTPGAPLTLLNFPTKRDYDGDGKADLNTYQSSDSTWFLFKSTAGFQTFHFGYSGVIPVVADFDGDGKTDAAYYDPPSGLWYWFGTKTGYHFTQFGHSGTIPVPADYDGDGKTDLGVFEPASGLWHIFRSSLGYTNYQFGYSASIPVPADYDGDGKADVAVFDPANSMWYILRSSAGFTQSQFGGLGFTPVPADYDGDHKADIAVCDTIAGHWYVSGSTGVFIDRVFGGNATIPISGDYDGDGKADFATYRLSTGTWNILSSLNNTTNITSFGWSGAPPVGVRP